MKLAVGFQILLLAWLPAMPLSAQDSGDIRHGLALARQACADCHAILAEQLQSPNPKSPTFRELANTPGMTNTALTIALTTPHAGMPMFRLSPEQRTDIIAYIRSLRR